MNLDMKMMSSELDGCLRLDIRGILNRGRGDLLCLKRLSISLRSAS